MISTCGSPALRHDALASVNRRTASRPDEALATNMTRRTDDTHLKCASGLRPRRPSMATQRSPKHSVWRVQQERPVDGANRLRGVAVWHEKRDVPLRRSLRNGD